MIKQIDENIKSMGMMLKPSKCRSFSLKSGKSVREVFKINDHAVPLIADEEQKFLGRVIFFSGKSSECFDLLKENLLRRLENLENTAIRPEFKLEIYQIYILPSIRFLLTVHDVPLSYQIRHYGGSIFKKVGWFTKMCHKRNITPKYCPAY